MIRKLLTAAVLVGSASAAFAESTTPGAYDARYLPAGASFEITEVFFADEDGHILIEGLGRYGDDTDVEVYDENGNCVAEGLSLDDAEFVTINPRWTGEFTIRVINNGDRANLVVLETM